MKIGKVSGVIVLALAGLVSLGGCSKYVKQADFDAAIAGLKSTDSQLQAQIDSLGATMQQRLAEYDARLTTMEGRIRVDTVAHFQFDESTLQSADKQMLDEFANIMQQYHPDALVTVEGFTDAAGSRAYNKKLGKQRADAVRAYLVSNAGMSAESVRAVSYGEDSNRQVDAGEIRESGQRNRRVALVIDFVSA